MATSTKNREGKKIILFTDRDNIEFRQFMLIVTNLLFILLSTFYFDTDSPIKYGIVRCIYFFFIGVVRYEFSFDEDKLDLSDLTDRVFTKQTIKGIKVWFCDFWSWVLMVWIFGVSIVDLWKLFQLAWCLSFFMLPERTYSPYWFWPQHLSIRQQDFRKYWKRKPMVQMLSVTLGAFLGSLICISDRIEHQEGVLYPLDTALVSSTIANTVSYLLF